MGDHQDWHLCSLTEDRKVYCHDCERNVWRDEHGHDVLDPTPTVGRPT